MNQFIQANAIIKNEIKIRFDSILKVKNQKMLTNINNKNSTEVAIWTYLKSSYEK